MVDGRRGTVVGLWFLVSGWFESKVESWKVQGWLLVVG